MEGGVERSVEDAEGLARGLANPARDPIAVHGAPGQRLEDKHVEGAEEDFEFPFVVGHGAIIPSTVDTIKG